MSQFQIIIGCQFVNKGISQEVINSVGEGGGRSGGMGKHRQDSAGETARDPVYMGVGGGGGRRWGDASRGRIAPDLDKVLLPWRADTSGDQRHSETFPACPRFRNEMSLSQAVP